MRAKHPVKNILAFSVVAQAYTALIGLILMPYYLRLMGPEAFGLIGFFMLLQAALPILELGFTQSLSREMSRWRAGALSAGEAWIRLRSLEVMLGGFALFAMLAISAGSQWLSHTWLNVSNLESGDVVTSLVAMAGAVGVRWFAGLYRASLIGMERQILVNSANMALATLRFGGVLLLLLYFSSAPQAFFGFQAGIAAMELLLFRWAMYRALPERPANLMPEWRVLQSMWPIAGSMGFLGAMSIVITQVDKLILSKTLSLEAYGYFTLAAVVASAVQILMPPLSQVLQPRMTILAEQGRHDQLRDLYRLSTQLASAIFISMGATLAIFAEPLLWAWTGDRMATQLAAPILVWYGLANGLLGVLLLPFMLQFAFGYLRLHVIGNILLLLILLPLLVYAAVAYGAVGVGISLAASRLLFLLVWVPNVHNKLLPGMALSWLLQDVAKVALGVLSIDLLALRLMPSFDDRLVTMLMIGFVLALTFGAGMLAGERSRMALIHSLKVRHD